MKNQMLLLACSLIASTSAFSQTYANGPCKNLMPDECAFYQRDNTRREAEQASAQAKKTFRADLAAETWVSNDDKFWWPVIERLRP